MLKYLIVFLIMASVGLKAEERPSLTLSLSKPDLYIDQNCNECTFNTGQCPGLGWFCLNGCCVQEHTGERCWNDIDCPKGNHCEDGVCR